MPLVPAKCRECRLIFPARGGIFVENVQHLSLSGNTYRPCPRCGGTADFLEGTFNVSQGLFEVLQAPETSVEMLRELRLILSDAEASSAPPELVLSKVEAVSPGIANSLRALVNDPDKFFKMLLALLALLTAIVAHDGKVEISVDAFNTFVNSAPSPHYQDDDEPGEGKSRESANAPEDRPKQ